MPQHQTSQSASQPTSLKARAARSYRHIGRERGWPDEVCIWDDSGDCNLTQWDIHLVWMSVRTDGRTHSLVSCWFICMGKYFSHTRCVWKSWQINYLCWEFHLPVFHLASGFTPPSMAMSSHEALFQMSIWRDLLFEHDLQNGRSFICARMSRVNRWTRGSKKLFLSNSIRNYIFVIVLL